jgi:hypothetical protein
MIFVGDVTLACQVELQGCDNHIAVKHSIPQHISNVHRVEFACCSTPKKFHPRSALFFDMTSQTELLHKLVNDKHYSALTSSVLSTCREPTVDVTNSFGLNLHVTRHHDSQQLLNCDLSNKVNILMTAVALYLTYGSTSAYYFADALLSLFFLV